MNIGINNIYKEKEMIIQTEILLLTTNNCTAKSLDTTSLAITVEMRLKHVSWFVNKIYCVHYIVLFIKKGEKNATAQFIN